MHTANLKVRFRQNRFSVDFYFAILSLVFCVPVQAQMIASYTGQVNLPISVFTGDGVQLEKGRYELEVRTEKNRRFLAFVRDGEVLALANAQPGLADENPDVPLVGTIYLYPAKSADETSKKSGQASDKKEKTDLMLAEYLESRPWIASMRVYECIDRAKVGVYFIFQEKAGAGQSSSIVFELFRKKPS